MIEASLERDARVTAPDRVERCSARRDAGAGGDREICSGTGHAASLADEEKARARQAMNIEKGIDGVDGRGAEPDDVGGSVRTAAGLEGFAEEVWVADLFASSGIDGCPAEVDPGQVP